MSLEEHRKAIDAIDEKLVRLLNERTGHALAIGAIYTPKRLIYAIPNSVTNLPGALSARAPGDRSIAYICRGTSCSQPLTSLAAIAAALSD